MNTPEVSANYQPAFGTMVCRWNGMAFTLRRILFGDGVTRWVTNTSWGCITITATHPELISLDILDTVCATAYLRAKVGRGRASGYAGLTVLTPGLVARVRPGGAS